MRNTALLDANSRCRLLLLHFAHLELGHFIIPRDLSWDEIVQHIFCKVHTYQLRFPDRIQRAFCYLICCLIRLTQCLINTASSCTHTRHGQQIFKLLATDAMRRRHFASTAGTVKFRYCEIGLLKLLIVVSKQPSPSCIERMDSERSVYCRCTVKLFAQPGYYSFHLNATDCMCKVIGDHLPFIATLLWRCWVRRLMIQLVA